MADLIITNARVWTVNRSQPTAQAIAIAGDRILAVGSVEEIEARRRPGTRVIDGRGRLVLPGFIDAHAHVMWGATRLSGIDLKDASSPEEFARRIGERARTAPDDWILGGGWDEQSWAGAQVPTRQIVDAVTPDTPVFVKRCDVHMALANSVALRLAGITAATPAPPGGSIGRDLAGAPTGILKDAAMQLVERVIPAPTPGQRRAAARLALRHMARCGVTSVHDMMPSFDDIDAYAQLEVSGELTARIYAAPLETAWYERDRSGESVSFASPFLEARAVKGFADGSLGSGTALFFEPYADEPANTGLLSDEMQSLDAMRDRLGRADACGRQLCIHAIGDRAIATTLDLFAAIERANGRRDRRFRIEHAQHMRPADFDRFAALRVVASVQPYHVVDDGRWAEKRIGAARLATSYAFRTFLDHGVRVAFGTDWPVAPLDPIQTIHAAVTRATLDGRHPGGWGPRQRLSIVEALEAYTAGAAYAQFAEGQKGTLAPGKLADLVALSDDVLHIESAAIADAKVEMTMVGGKIVYERDA